MHAWVCVRSGPSHALRDSLLHCLWLPHAPHRAMPCVPLTAAAWRVTPERNCPQVTVPHKPCPSPPTSPQPSVVTPSITEHHLVLESGHRHSHAMPGGVSWRGTQAGNSRTDSVLRGPVLPGDAEEGTGLGAVLAPQQQLCFSSAFVLKSCLVSLTCVQFAAFCFWSRGRNHLVKD